MIHTLLQAVGLVFVIEGLLYALVPSHVKAILARLEGMSGEQLRFAGAAALAALKHNNMHAPAIAVLNFFSITLQRKGGLHFQ